MGEGCAEHAKTTRKRQQRGGTQVSHGGYKARRRGDRTNLIDTGMNVKTRMGTTARGGHCCSPKLPRDIWTAAMRNGASWSSSIISLQRVITVDRTVGCERLWGTFNKVAPRRQFGPLLLFGQERGSAKQKGQSPILVLNAVRYAERGGLSFYMYKRATPFSTFFFCRERTSGSEKASTHTDKI